jgi:hypothetical protein
MGFNDVKQTFTLIHAIWQGIFNGMASLQSSFSITINFPCFYT